MVDALALGDVRQSVYFNKKQAECVDTDSVKFDLVGKWEDEKFL